MADDGRREPDSRDAASSRDDEDRRCTLCGRSEPAEHLLRLGGVRL